VIEYSHRTGLKGLLDAARTVRRIRRRYFHAAVLLPNSFSSACLVACAGVPLRVGTRGQWRRLLLTHPVAPRPEGLHQATHYVQIAATLAAAPPPGPPRVGVGDEYAAWATRFLVEQGVNSEAPIVGLSPGAAYGPAKRWLPERFAQVGRRLRDSFGAQVLVFGAREDAPVTAPIAEQIGPGAHDLAGRTTIGRLAALMARCRVVITNDSGAMHLAGAVGTNVVAIFGSTSPERTSPAGAVTIIKKDCDCAPCLLRECPTDFRCMTSISADDVLEPAAAYLGDAR
jgi:heptosyltransferase-2